MRRKIIHPVVSLRRQRLASGEVSPLDVWLQRVSHFAQLGLLTATLLGFYFTVIPLYQKAALDEQMAKTTIELQAAQVALREAQDAAYSLERLNFQRGLAFAASDSCTAFRQSISQDEKKDPFANMKIDVRRCLTGELKSRNPDKLLRPGDAKYIESALDELGAILEIRRTEVQDQIARVPQLARQSPGQLDPPGQFLKRYYEFQDQAAVALGQPLSSEVKQQRITRAVDDTQRNHAGKFQQFAMDKIRSTVMQADWPERIKASPGSASIIPR